MVRGYTGKAHTHLIGAYVSKPVVLIAEELSPATISALGPDFEVRHCDGSDRAELLPAIADVDAILIRSATKVDAEALAAAKNLKVVARAGVGLDNVDVSEATQRGVMVVNAPTSNIVSAAELAVGLLLASARNISPAHAALRQGEWKRSKYSGVELADKTVGVVGLGRIGLLVAQRLSAFGVKLIAYDPFVRPTRAAQLGVRMVDLDELLEQSDFITVHLPKNKDTLGLIGDEALRKVKPTVHIVNAARGGIVDEAALYEALVDGRVAGAGLDVYAKEPCTDSPLFGLDNVVATPHLGASTDEAQEKAGVAVAKSVRQALAGQLVPDAVNVRGGVIAEPVRPFLDLTENLGRLATALAPAPVSRVDVEVLGELAEFDVSILELAAVKGMFSVLIDEPVSYVNAPVLAGDRGVETSLATEGEYDDHRALVKVGVSCSDGYRLSVAGTVVGLRDEPKLVEIDDAAVDVPVSEHMLVFRYPDKPGVVGMVGGGLGDAGVNIANMQVSRTDDAVTMVLSVDSTVSDDVVETIAAGIDASIGRAVDLAE
ncbi:MAG: phosphoglycerate dehydrogenase [Actinobacteria bacterium]|nr:phosphoglycerate dehydrogenase [Actinomycetota bacterium]